MKCPSCGKEVRDNMSYCDGCGALLYGPRSISLNDLGGGNNTIQSNNIKSITGIDINDLTPVGPNHFPEIKTQEENKKKKIPKGDKKINIGTIIFLIVIGVLLAFCIYLFVQNNQLKNVDTPLVTPPVAEHCIEGYYGLTNSYAFLLPDNWIYTQTENEVVLTNKEISMLIFKTAEGKVDHITAEALKSEYVKQGYSIVTVEESTLNSKKIMYVKFTTNDINFVDFYYQYDGEKVVYGQVSSSKNDLLTEDVKNIISSIVIQTRDNSITVGKAPVAYDNILSLLN